MPRKHAASSRLMPNVVCVRSLVPNEKNSALSRDLVGHQRRARQLDHGADLVVELDAGFLRHRLRHRVDARLDDVELGLGGDQRHHHLRHHRLAGALAGLDRGLEDRARLHLGDLGIGDGDAAAAEAEHRVELGSSLARCSSFFGSAPIAAATSAMSSSPCGRNSCSGGSSSRIVTGRPLHDLEQLDEVAALHRQELGERRAARSSRRRRGSSRAPPGCGPRRRTCARCGRARCPRRRTGARCRASAGVSALARTPSLRTLSAQPISVPNSPDSAGSIIGTRAGQHLAGRAVDGDDLAALEHGVAGAAWSARCSRRAAEPAPETQGLPMPRATTAACEVMPPRVVRMPSAACMPWMSSGEVSTRTRMTFLPSALSRVRLVGRRTRSRRRPRPARPAGRSRSPCARRSGSMVGCSSWSSEAGSIRATASSLVISFSFASSTAMRSAALAVRLPFRVCSIQSLPCSTVNSRSCMSR